VFCHISYCGEWRILHLHGDLKSIGLPSWCWAAVEGEVKETFHVQQEDKVGKDTCVLILEAKVAIPSSEVTDIVTGGYIKMSGRLARGTLIQQDQSNAAMSTRAQNGEATAIYGVPELHLHLKDNKSGLLDKTPNYDVISESFQYKEVYCLPIRHTKILTHELWYHGGSPSRTEIPNVSSTKPRTKTRIRESSKVVSHDGRVRGFTVRCTAREYLPSTERLDPRPDRQCTKRVQENRHLGCPRVRCRREESIRSGVQCI
jgi:hypothetical protein